MRNLPFAVYALLLIACNQTKDSTEIKNAGNKFSAADKMVYRSSDGTHPGAVVCTITVTLEEIRLTMDAMADEGEVKKTYPFTQKKWDKLVASFENLRVKGKANNDCDGSGSERLIFYKGDDEITSADDFKCREGSRNFSGADIDLTYLIKDFDELKASLGNREKTYEDDENGGWSATDKKSYLRECLKLTKAMGLDEDANAYCNCTLEKLEAAYATKHEADENLSEAVTEQLQKCATSDNAGKNER